MKILKRGNWIAMDNGAVALDLGDRVLILNADGTLHPAGKIQIPRSERGGVLASDDQAVNAAVIKAVRDAIKSQPNTSVVQDPVFKSPRMIMTSYEVMQAASYPDDSPPGVCDLNYPA